MKARMFSNWTLTRALYLVIGGSIVVQSVMNAQWFMMGFGVYFAAMGLFAFGCASGNCATGQCVTDTTPRTTSEISSSENKI